MPSSRHSHTKADQSLAAASRDLIFERRWTAVGIWAATLGGWLLLFWAATNMNSPAAQLAMPTGEWSGSELAGGVRHVGRYDGGDDAAFGGPDGDVFFSAEPAARRWRANFLFRSRISRVVGRLQWRGDRCAMGAAIGGMGFAHDREHVARIQRGAASDRGSISVQPDQTCLPARMSFATWLPDERLERWAFRRLADGNAPWHLPTGISVDPGRVSAIRIRGRSARRANKRRRPE
jgi:hypothetical protein